MFSIQLPALKRIGMEKQDIPSPKGKGTVCYYCGFISGLRNRCQRCNHNFTYSARVVDLLPNHMSVPLHQLPVKHPTQESDIPLPKGKASLCYYCGCHSGILNRCQRCKNKLTGAIIMNRAPSQECLAPFQPLSYSTEDIPSPVGKRVLCRFCGFFSGLMNRCQRCNKRFFDLVNMSPSCTSLHQPVESQPSTATANTDRVEKQKPETSEEEANPQIGIKIKEEPGTNEIPEDSNSPPLEAAIKEEPEAKETHPVEPEANSSKREAASQGNGPKSYQPIKPVVEFFFVWPSVTTHKTEQAEKDVPSPKGRGFVCQHCGYISYLMNRCQRCQRKWVGLVQVVDVTTSSPYLLPSQGPVAQFLASAVPEYKEQRHGTCYTNLERLRCVTLSNREKSGSCDQPEAKKSRTEEGLTNSLKEQLTEWRQSEPEGNVIEVKCRSARIGSYKVVPSAGVLFSPDGFMIQAPILRRYGKPPPYETADLVIPKSYIRRFDVHFSKITPAIFIYLKPLASGYVRNHLRMSKYFSAYWFDAQSNDEKHKRITLLPEQLTGSAKQGIERVFSLMGVYNEITAEEANRILVLSSP